MPSLGSSPRRVAAAAGLTATAALGLAAERSSSAWSEVDVWVPDLAVGGAFVAASALSRRRPAVAMLLAAAGAAWFAGTAWPELTFLHRAVLAHLALAAPGWRPRHRVDIAVVAAVYIASVRPDLWGDEWAGSVLAVAVAALTAVRYLTSPIQERSGRHVGLIAGGGLAVAVVGSALARELAPPAASTDWVLTAYQAVMGWIAAASVVRVRTAPVASVTDLIVDLGDEPAGPLEEALRSVLGDPTLRVGYRAPGGGYVDGAGGAFGDAGASTGDRTVTTIGDEGNAVAILVHDASIGADARLVEAVRLAARLRRTHAALTAEINRRVDEVAASRRRLLVVADEERRQLQGRLRSGPERVLEELRAEVDVLASGRPGDALAPVGHRLTETLADLDAIAEGLHPRDLDDGLAIAVARLAHRCPVPVVVDIGTVDRVPDDIAVAAYFVCAEALTNVAKHADASRVELAVGVVGDAVVLVVDDDGTGGADPASGSGLRGLVDRVEALGGTLVIGDRAEGVGTRLRAELALGPPRPD